MEPIKFEGINTVFAKDQPEYLPLPAFKGQDGTVISCWRLTIMERLRLLFTGRLWLRILTFNQPLQPQRVDVKYPFMGQCWLWRRLPIYIGCLAIWSAPEGKQEGSWVETIKCMRITLRYPGQHHRVLFVFKKGCL